MPGHEQESKIRERDGPAMVGHDRVVAVTGATGRQGGAVTRHLLANPTPTRELLPTAVTVREWLVRRRS